MLLGMRMRAVAMVRAIWKTSGGTKSPSGVPSTGTSALMGTDSGCCGSEESSCSRPMRSASDSPGEG